MYYFISYYYYYFKSFFDHYFSRDTVICAEMLDNKELLEQEIKISDNFLSDDNGGDLVEIRKILDTLDIENMYSNLLLLSSKFNRKSDIESILDFLIKERNFNAEYNNNNSNYLTYENNQNNITLLNELILNFTILKIVLKKMN